MKKTYNDVPNLHAIVLRYLGTTEHRGARLLLYSPRFEQRIIVSRDYATSNIVEQGYNELTARGYNIVGVAETHKDGYTLLTDTFRALRDSNVA